MGALKTSEMDSTEHVEGARYKNFLSTPIIREVRALWRGPGASKNQNGDLKVPSRMPQMQDFDQKCSRQELEHFEEGER